MITRISHNRPAAFAASVFAAALAAIAIAVIGVQIFGASPSGSAEPPPPMDESALSCPETGNPVTEPGAVDVDYFASEVYEPRDGTLAELNLDPAVAQRLANPDGALGSVIEDQGLDAAPSDFTAINEGATWRDYALDEGSHRTAIIRVVRLPISGLWAGTDVFSCQ